MNIMKVRALKIRQAGNTVLYSFFIRGKDILRVADISRVKRNDADVLEGYQRGTVRQHIEDISKYLDSGEVLFPNAIIMAMTSEVAFKQSRGPSIDGGDAISGVLELPLREDQRKIAWIVDGQQRTFALAKSKNNDMLVPVTAFVSDDFDVHRSQFLLVNKVKPLPNGLINELLPVVNTTLPRGLAQNKIPSRICDILNRDPESPFFGLIKRHTTDVKKNKSAVVTDTGLLTVIRTSLNNGHGCLFQYKNMATGEVDVDRVLATLNLYWSEVKKVFPDAWGLPPSKSRLMHTVGIRSMGVLMDRVMSTLQYDDPKAKEKINAALESIKPHCAWTGGAWEELGKPWDLQATPKDIKGLTELLTNLLVRRATGTLSE